MLAPDDYTLGKCLHTDPRYQVYAAVRDADGHGVALKSYSNDTRSRARAELEALTALACPAIVRPLALLESPEGPVLVLDQIQAASLRGWVQAGQPTDAEFLEVAIQITQAVMHVHAAHWLHRDLRPEHILVASAPLKVQLTGFGQAQPFGTASDPEDLRAQAKGAAALLPFIAPEQTGRMGRGIDARSDLYSLGATFYFALTGKAPFESQDALALVHAHMARMPVSPLEHQPRLSPTLARIVMKLLQKQPEDRYQTARALDHDLRICRDQLARAGRIDEELPLGTADVPVRPLFRRTLYGREAEVLALHAAYGRAVRGGNEVVSLRGAAGSGKSSLVQELRRFLPDTAGYLAAGKFDHYRRDVPYAGISAALSALLDQIFTESDARLARWRHDLQAALGGLAGALLELIPELKLLLGEVPPCPALGPDETRARLAIAVQRFVRGCASGEHPLVLFLDDIQWADPGTLELLEELVLHGETQHLLTLLAYRDDEIGPDHAIERLLARLPDAVSIALLPMTLDATSEFLTGALGRDREATRDLAATVLRKTGGLPLLIQQFTLHLHAVGLLRFEEPGGWIWDPAAVEKVEISADAVGLMVAKLERLEVEARGVLLFASCVASEFDVGLLHDLSGRSRESLDTALCSLAEDGLISPSSRGYRFVHDRVREAAQAMLSADERARVHWGVAKHLLEALDPEPLGARIFEVLEHLNGGLALVPDSLRLRVVELNTEAGRRSLAAGAAATAHHYLTLARQSFEALNAREHRKLGFELSLLSAEGAFRTGATNLALELLAPLDANPLTRIESARVIGLRVQIYSITHTPIECVRYSLLELKKFGVRWSLRPSDRSVLRAARRVRRMLHGRADGELLKPADTVDLDKLATILLIDLTSASLSQADTRFAALAASHVLSDYLRYGYIGRPGFSLAGYASCTFWFLLDAELAERAGRLALEWCDRVPDPLWDPRTAFLIHALLDPWFKSRRETATRLQATLRKLKEVGDAEWVYHCDSMLVLNDLLAGCPVAEIDARLEELGKIAARDFRYSDFLYVRRVYQPLAEDDPGRVRLEGDAFSDDLARGVGWEANEPIVRTAWLMTLTIYGAHDRALAESDAGFHKIARLSPWTHNADYIFYRGLAAAAVCGTRDLPWSRKRRIARDALRRLRRFAQHGPDFVHMAEVLDAERARLAGDISTARQLYQSAARSALRQRFIHHAALAHERQASMLRDRRRHTEAGQVLSLAIACYEEWGARAKARSLQTLLRE